MCPYQRRADYWRGTPYPICILRYSDEALFRRFVDFPAYNYGRGTTNVSSPVQFKADLRILVENMRDQAAQGGSLRKIAAGNLSTADDQIIFVLAQCTPDLTLEDCTFCLNWNLDWMGTCCDSRIRTLIIRPSCTLQYDISLFYNESRLLELALNPTPPQSPTPPPSPTLPGTGKHRTRIIIVVAVSVSTCLLLLLFVGFLLKRRIKQMLKKTFEAEISFQDSLQYEYDEIRAATNNFSEDNKLGQGGYGPVYRGKLPDGKEIAVKRLSSESCQGDLEFENEVNLLAKLQHRNLVRLLGFSIERAEKLLVYEFLQNTSLDRFIFGHKRILNLDWDQRYKIIRGIARGILYLHEDSRIRIIHRDLKASNILLDVDTNPKIADFGTARLFVLDETRAKTSRIVGT